MIKIKITQDKKKNIIAYLFLAVISAIICIPILKPDFNITFDDGIQHICRIIGTFQTITEGQPFGAIMSDYCNGFGYSWNLFYSPITSYRPINI